MSAAEHRNIAAADALMGVMGFRRVVIDLDEKPSLAPHQVRVVDESRELHVKLGALATFCGTATFAALDAAEQTRLRRQLDAMKLYANILQERIGAFHA